MSGGFFRGTSADQDTRFSNKQAKLMKSQKFPPELENLVDMSKVKMDVIRPWIANRVTELLGFEDEVLINFIYSLLDGKEVNGKEVQISLTGFMEKNTGKFMKELWTLLLSAQRNESGVPQQFLDAKEEETRKKQAEMDRITSELQKKKEEEGRELERERSKKMDGGFGIKGSNAAAESNSKQMLPKDSSRLLEFEKEIDKRNGLSGRNRVSRSPYSADRSPSSPGGSPVRISKSVSNSRSYSGQKSRSRSRSPETRGRSISSRSPRRRSISPIRGRSPSVSRSPPRRRSYSRRRYRSPSRSRSHSPVRHRFHSPTRRRRPSPMQYRSPSPVRRSSPAPYRRRRSPSPIRHRNSRSPIRRHRSPRRRSPSPVRRRGSSSSVRRRRSPSPLRRRSPSPLRRRSPSPLRRRSPSPARRRSRSLVRRRSPSPMRSPSPVRRRSPSPLRRRSPSPFRRRSPPLQRRSPVPSRHRHQKSPSPSSYRSPSAVEDRSPILARKRSPASIRRTSLSPYESSSQSPVRRRSVSPVIKRSPREHMRSPLQSPERRVRSPHRALKDQKHLRNKALDLSPSPKGSPVRTKSPSRIRNRSASVDRSPFDSPGQDRRQVARDISASPPGKGRERKPHHDSPATSKEDEEAVYTREGGHYKTLHGSNIGEQKDSTVKVPYKDEHAYEPRSRTNYMESRKKDQDVKSGKSSGRGEGPDTVDGHKSPAISKDSLMGIKPRASYAQEDKNSDEQNRLYSNNTKGSDKLYKSEKSLVLIEKGKCDSAGDTVNSDSEESEKHRPEKKEKRKHRKSHQRDVASDDDYSYDSEYEDRKEAKRRRKEEKKLRKEEKRRRREERRHRREKRRAEKLRSKERNSDSSSDEDAGRKKLCPSDGEEAQSEQKKLEIELRNKALESLKAKKGISH